MQFVINSFSNSLYSVSSSVTVDVIQTYLFALIVKNILITTLHLNLSAHAAHCGKT